jgi:hypothetical protein
MFESPSCQERPIIGKDLSMEGVAVVKKVSPGQRWPGKRSPWLVLATVGTVLGSVALGPVPFAQATALGVLPAGSGMGLTDTPALPPYPPACSQAQIDHWIQVARLTGSDQQPACLIRYTEPYGGSTVVGTALKISAPAVIELPDNVSTTVKISIGFRDSGPLCAPNATVPGCFDPNSADSAGLIPSSATANTAAYLDASCGSMVNGVIKRTEDCPGGASLTSDLPAIVATLNHSWLVIKASAEVYMPNGKDYEQATEVAVRVHVA